MTDTRQFYTYLHCKPDGYPFYIGKGTGKRAHEFRRRNNRHMKTIAKYGKGNIKVFIFNCNSEKEAFKDEIERVEPFAAGTEPYSSLTVIKYGALMDRWLEKFSVHELQPNGQKKIRRNVEHRETLYAVFLKKSLVGKGVAK